MSIEKVKILVTVKTYPLPSKEYQELVCTAGFKENGDWIRLYPVPFRHLPHEQQYKKYTWVEAEVIKQERDPRVESYRPCGVIKLLNSVDTSNNWQERKKIVLKNVFYSLEVLKQESKKGVSLGVLKPKEIQDFVVESAAEEWKDKWQSLYKQERLFGDKQKPLDKIPYKFSYKFTCHDNNCRGHKIMIEDWEVYALYRKLFKKTNSKDIAIEKVKQKYLEELPTKCDLYFLMGTTRKDHHRGTFLIIGLFYPLKIK